MKHLRIFALFLVLLVFSATAFAQKPEIKAVETKAAVQTSLAAQDFKLASKLMAREMPYRVILPKNYDADKNAKFPVLYLLHGLAGHFDNWTEKTKLKQYAADYPYIIVTPEGGNGFYTDSPKNANDKYESYIIQELIPEIDGKFRTLADREHRFIAGLSMGGYGAMKFGLKYPQLFVLAGSFSGAISASSYRSETDLPAGFLRDALVGIFGAPDSETHLANNLFKMISEMPPEKAAALPFLYIDCGTEDELGLLAPNKMFVDILVKRKILHEFRQLPGRHNWAYWDAQVQEFLRVSQKFVK